jgi:hypothetical protein
LNACRRPSAASLLRWWVIPQLLVLFLASLGCMGGGAPPPEGQLQIENVAKWYILYRADNRGKPPADEDAFVAFVQNKLKSRGEADESDQLLTSPRDGQKYVVHYGKPTSTSPERNVAVYEKEGYRGKKLVAFESGYSREVDEAELQSLLAGN